MKPIYETSAFDSDAGEPHFHHQRNILLTNDQPCRASQRECKASNPRFGGMRDTRPFTLCQLEGQEQSQSNREDRQRRNTWRMDPNQDERGHGIRRTKSSRSQDKRNQYLQFPWSGGATSRNGCIPMLPLQTSSCFLFLRAALIPYPLFRENSTIDKRRFIVLTSL